jgi:hypothetical protein
MPVRYDIAAQIPQYGGGGGYDPVNMMAQLQSMDYRQQQNALAQLQMQKLQRELQMQGALSGVLTNPNFNVQSPEAVGALVHSGNLSEGLSVLGAQRSAAAQAALASHYGTQENLARRKYEEIELPEAGIRREYLDFQKTKEGRLATEAIHKADAAALDLGIKQTAQAQDFLSQATPETWSDDYERIKAADPHFASKFKPDAFPDKKLFDTAMRNADFTRKIAEERAKELAQAEAAQPQMPSWAPGYIMRRDPATGGYRLEAPQQPGMRMPQNAMTPAVPGQNAFTNAPPPAAPAEEPTPPMGTPEYAQRRSARAMLEVAGVDPENNVNHVADLIRDTPSSAFRAYAQQKEGAFKGKATPQMENVGRLNTIIENIKLAASEGKLGSGVSDADMRLLDRAQAQINDPAVQPNQRMAAWDEVVRIQAKRAGLKYTPMTAEQIRGEPIIGERKPAKVDETSILTDIFGAKK